MKHSKLFSVFAVEAWSPQHYTFHHFKDTQHLGSLQKTHLKKVSTSVGKYIHPSLMV